MSFLLGCFGWRPSRMPRAEEKTTLVWLLTLKILMIIPVAIAAFSAKNTYTSIRKHEELQQSPPYDKHVLLSQLLVYIGTMSLFPWLFISCALVLVWKGPWLFLYGVVDLGLLVTICIGLSMEGNYLPSSVKSCSTSKVTTWQVVDNHPSFFVQAASYDPNPNPQQKCKTFVTTWSLGVVVAFFQAVLAYIGIFFDEREHSLLNPFRPLFYFVLALIGGPFLFHAHITPRLRFSISYALKSLRHLFGQHPLIFPRPAPYTPNHDKPIHTQNPRLHAILTIEHVALNVVSHMHYEDVIALSLACRSVREAVFPSRDLAFRVPKLRARCCVPVTKAPCAYCKKEICSECHVLVSAKGVPGARHVEKCLPYCRTCYFRDFSKRGRRGAGAARACRCARDEGGVQEERVCRTCCGQSERGEGEEMRRKRQKRYVQEVRERVLGEGVVCASCKGELKEGVRWWICGKCQGECRATIHPPYVGRRREVDVEKGEKGVDELREKEGTRSKWLAMFSIR